MTWHILSSLSFTQRFIRHQNTIHVCIYVYNKQFFKLSICYKLTLCWNLADMSINDAESSTWACKEGKITKEGKVTKKIVNVSQLSETSWNIYGQVSTLPSGMLFMPLYYSQVLYNSTSSVTGLRKKAGFTQSLSTVRTIRISTLSTKLSVQLQQRTSLHPWIAPSFFWDSINKKVLYQRNWSNKWLPVSKSFESWWS